MKSVVICYCNTFEPIWTESIFTNASRVKTSSKRTLLFLLCQALLFIPLQSSLRQHPLKIISRNQVATREAHLLLELQYSTRDQLLSVLIKPRSMIFQTVNRWMALMDQICLLCLFRRWNPRLDTIIIIAFVRCLDLFYRHSDHPWFHLLQMQTCLRLYRLLLSILSLYNSRHLNHFLGKIYIQSRSTILLLRLHRHRTIVIGMLIFTLVIFLYSFPGLGLSRRVA